MNSFVLLWVNVKFVLNIFDFANTNLFFNSHYPPQAFPYSYFCKLQHPVVSEDGTEAAGSISTTYQGED